MALKKIQKRARTPVSPLRKRIPRAAKTAASEKLTNLFKKDSAASQEPAKPAVQTRPISKKRKSESESKPESVSLPKKIAKDAAANKPTKRITKRLSSIQSVSEESESESDSDSPDPPNKSVSSQSTKSTKSTSSTRSKESSISKSSESESSESTSLESLASESRTKLPIKNQTNKSPRKSSIKKQIIKYTKSKPKAPTLAPAPKSKLRPPPIKTKNTSHPTKSPGPSKGKTKKKSCWYDLVVVTTANTGFRSPSLWSPPEILPGPLPRSPGPKKKPPLLPGAGVRRQSTETQLRSYQLGTRNPQRGLVDSSLEISPTAPRVQTSRRRREQEGLERKREEGEASQKKERKERKGGISLNSAGSEEFAPSSGEQMIDLTAIRERHDVERARFPKFFESIEEEIGELADELGLDRPVDVELLDGKGKPRTLRDTREAQLKRRRDMRKKKLKGKK